MSYIADIEAVFKAVAPFGTFLFTSEVAADDTLRNVPTANYPIFVIDDNPLNTTISINQDSSATDMPRLKIYVLTKFDLSGNEVVESNSSRFFQHEECIAPMKDLIVRVMGKYFRQGGQVSRQRNLKPTITTTDKYNLWSKMLYGVEANISNLTLRRIINYCDEQLTFYDTDAPGVDIPEDYVPNGTEEMILEP